LTSFETFADFSESVRGRIRYLSVSLGLETCGPPWDDVFIDGELRDESEFLDNRIAFVEDFPQQLEI
jgi:hypothetical protein